MKSKFQQFAIKNKESFVYEHICLPIDFICTQNLLYMNIFVYLLILFALTIFLNSVFVKKV